MTRGPTRYVLTGADGRPFESAVPGLFGGHRRGKLYGRLDCPAALNAIARGGYVAHRVFFADQQTAVSAGYRPCAACLPEQYAVWTSDGPNGDLTIPGSRTSTGRDPNARSERP